ncbi:MAG: YXWGXW repeat-containing protein [Alphaproteobacteria bacterium]|nr:YXWGXW repeat-containing protein [Alphaproteobacteria bacterium]
MHIGSGQGVGGFGQERGATESLRAPSLGGDDPPRWLLRALILAVSASLAGCAAKPSRPITVIEIVAPRPPPPVRTEVVPPPPQPIETVEWRPGHWQWTGHDYVWSPGQYMARPDAHAVWEPDHWVETSSGWSWVPGRWR